MKRYNSTQGLIKTCCWKGAGDKEGRVTQFHNDEKQWGHRSRRSFSFSFSEKGSHSVLAVIACGVTQFLGMEIGLSYSY